ncbi:universal stress protein, partial [Pseudoroseomonas cervicalis]|uniref:universal stress protein n=1 Tax=Teichococcus cervicalis TaxID=204525 RepID=UPI003593CA93
MSGCARRCPTSAASRPRSSAAGTTRCSIPPAIAGGTAPMIRSILVALDDTPGAAAAAELAIALARRSGAQLTAAVVLD